MAKTWEKLNQQEKLLQKQQREKTLVLISEREEKFLWPGLLVRFYPRCLFDEFIMHVFTDSTLKNSLMPTA